MMYAFLYGYGTGIVLSSMLGTVFFALIQNSIDNGIKSNIFLSLGVILSDLLLITLSYFNAQLIPKGGQAEMVVRVIGAVFILGLGLSNLLRKAKAVYAHTEGKSLILFARGFALNFFNPGNFFSWIAVSALLRNVLHFSVGGRVAFYAGSLLGIFCMEMVVSVGALYLKKYLNDQHLHNINRAMGVLFIVFAIVLLWPVFVSLF